MNRFGLLALGVMLLASAGKARAADLRSFCPDRPGLGTPPCTMDPGHADVEMGLADWTIDRQPGERTDTIVLADTLLRVGLTDTLEAQLEWQGYGLLRDRIAGTGASHDSGSGDVRLAVSRNLSNPDGSGFSLAVMPFVTLPVGSNQIGAGDWTAGLIVPVSFALPHGLQLAFTGELDAAADSDGNGHHAAYSGTLGLALPLSGTVGATLELQQSRDEDPSGATDMTLAGLSVAWLARPSLQLDAGANIGIGRNAPDLELYAGVARRF